ncbi:MAG TPA: 50S ribosomal protein L13 [Bdellovibrionales bacterium]|nr:50S ribosomal protein L13 [Bdellovibrionales bacterium]
MKTWNAKAGEVEQKWYVVDAAGKTLGRISTEIAKIIRGKNKPTFTPHVDTGDFVVVINSEKVEMSGTKWADEKFYSHSRFFGSLKELSAAQMREKDPTIVIKEAVAGMLPKTKLSKRVIHKLKAYKGPNHPHASQKPEMLNLK